MSIERKTQICGFFHKVTWHHKTKPTNGLHCRARTTIGVARHTEGRDAARVRRGETPAPTRRKLSSRRVGAGREACKGYAV